MIMMLQVISKIRDNYNTCDFRKFGVNRNYNDCDNSNYFNCNNDDSNDDTGSESDEYNESTFYSNENDGIFD